MGLRPQVPVPSTPQNEDVSHQRGRLSCAVRNAAPSSQGGRESRTQKLFAISQAQVLLSVATMIISSVLVLGPSPTSQKQKQKQKPLSQTYSIISFSAPSPRRRGAARGSSRQSPPLGSWAGFCPIASPPSSQSQSPPRRGGEEAQAPGSPLRPV